MNALIDQRNAFATDHPEDRRRLNGRNWGVVRAGTSGPAILLIPGTLGRADIFWQQISALAQEARICAVSYPDSGGIADWARDLADLLVQEDMTGATVLGSSLGGYLAQYLTATHDHLVGALVAANTLHSTDGIDRQPPYSLDLRNTPIDALREGFAAGLRPWLSGRGTRAQLAGLLLEEVAGRIPEMELRARLLALKNAPSLPPQTLDRAAIFTVESADDHLITAPMREALRGALNPGRAFQFGAASHFPYVTRPDAYTDLLREVLGLDPPGTFWPVDAGSTP